eukprot:5139368-Pyramimonas_sp.AAC.1
MPRGAPSLLWRARGLSARAGRAARRPAAARGCGTDCAAGARPRAEGGRSVLHERNGYRKN